MKKLLLPMIIASLVSGCAMFTEDELVQQVDADSTQLVETGVEGGNLELDKSILKSSGSVSHTNRGFSEQKWQAANRFSPKVQKNINDYARGIMQDLLANLQYVGSATPVAVADFVNLDSDFNTSSLIGKQLAEAFSHEVHKLGIPVVDYKLTDYIRVTSTGSIALSKDYLELSGEIPIRYILTGTLLTQESGVIVNARVVGAESKAIVASAQGIIPVNVLDFLLVNSMNDGMR